MKNKALFRVNGGYYIGFGHIIRCLSLAEGLSRKGFKNLFIIKGKDREVLRRITEKGNLVKCLPFEIDLEKDLDLTLNIIKEYEADLVITDSYEFNKEYLKKIKRLGVFLLTIDDLGIIHFFSDIILNQNVGFKEEDYSKERYTKLLLGPKYALLREEIKSKPRKRKIKEVKKILITFGYHDSYNQSLKVVKAIKNIIGIEVFLILGPGYEGEHNLRKEVDNKFFIIRNPDQIFDIMVNTDIAISGGGSTCFELAYLGIPNIIIILAENQKKLAQRLDEYGTSINLGWFKDVTEEDIKEAVVNLMNNRKKREEMSRRGKSLVDGKGVERVIEEITNSLLGE